MSKVTATVRTARTTTEIDAGYDPAIGVMYLDLYDPVRLDSEPTYSSMFHHPAGLTTYGLLEMTADLEQRVGHSCPQVTTAVASLGLTANTFTALGFLELN